MVRAKTKRVRTHPLTFPVMRFAPWVGRLDDAAGETVIHALHCRRIAIGEGADARAIEAADRFLDDVRLGRLNGAAARRKATAALRRYERAYEQAYARRVRCPACGTLVQRAKLYAVAPTKSTKVIFVRSEGWWVVSIKGVPGAYTQGKTKAEARDNLIDVLVLLVEFYRTEGKQEKVLHGEGWTTGLRQLQLNPKSAIPLDQVMRRYGIKSRGAKRRHRARTSVRAS